VNSIAISVNPPLTGNLCPSKALKGDFFSIQPHVTITAAHTVDYYIKQHQRQFTLNECLLNGCCIWEANKMNIIGYIFGIVIMFLLSWGIEIGMKNFTFSLISNIFVITACFCKK